MNNEDEGRERRVISIHTKWKSKGEFHERRIQYLEEKRKYRFTFFGLLPSNRWVRIDSEVVPSHVWLQHAIFGDQLTGWVSKFKDYIKK